MTASGSASRAASSFVDDSPAALLASVDLVAFGHRVRSTRVQQGLTQESVAGVDISGAYVSRIEAGQRRPELAVAQLLADRLGTTLDYLVTGVAPQHAAELTLALRYAELALNAGEAQDAETQIGQLLEESADDLGPLVREAQWIHARSLEAIGRIDDAASLLEELVAQPGHRYWFPAAIALCRCYREAGDLSRSIEVGQEALRHSEELGLEGTEDAVRLAVSLVGAYYERGDELYAFHLCRSAIRLAEKVGSPTARSSAYWNASILASCRGEAEEAVRLADKALTLMSDTDDVRTLARLRRQLGALLIEQVPPDTAQAERQIRKARRDLIGADGSTVDVARCDVGLARTHLTAGDLDTAEQLAAQALELLGGQGPFVAAGAEAVLGRVEHRRSNRKEAQRHFRRAVEALSAAGADRSAAALWFELGAFFDEAGDSTGAKDAYRHAAEALGMRTAAPIGQLV